MTRSMTTEIRLRIGMITVVILTVCLVITTYALMRVTLDLKENTFYTGQIGIDLNGGEPIIDPNDALFKRFEPGVLAETDFYIKNDKSTWAVYYRLYFKEISGALANVLEVTITDPNPDPEVSKGPKASDFFTDERRKKYVRGEVLYHGTLADLTRVNVHTANDTLEVGEMRELCMYFYFPTEKGNETMNKEVSFTVCADAVQTKNNDQKDFGPDLN